MRGVLGHFRLHPCPERPERLVAAWRGAIASRFPDDPDFHGHVSGGVLRRYPPVQYRATRRGLCVLALGESAERLIEHPWAGTRLRIGPGEAEVVEVCWEPVGGEIGAAERLLRYRFVSPWIALNQENHASWVAMDEAERRYELDRILIGNLLSLASGIGVRIEGQIYAAAAPEGGSVPCRVKGVLLRGFRGGFVTNLELPDHLALGKSVSLGYGWFGRLAGRSAS